MVDVKNQYLHIKEDIDNAIQSVIDSTAFINGAAVKEFKTNFEEYLKADTVIPCANGTDALQIAMMALGLKPGDEVIVPAFTYVATAEVIALLNLVPVMVDVDPLTFNLSLKNLKGKITDKTKAIVPVNLYGQCADLYNIKKFAEANNIYIIEDNAQAIGADFILPDGSKVKAGLVGDIGTTSFYPSKNLGAYGDGGACYTNNPEIGEKIRMVANHGQSKKYVHDIIGCNSRLDSIQAAILNVKLKHLDNYAIERNKVANYYDDKFKNIDELNIPFRMENSTHVFHQYTLKVKNGKRDRLKSYLMDNGIPSMIYYPIPLYNQKAFSSSETLPVTEELCNEVLSLPIHTEMDEVQLNYISSKVIEFFN